MIRSQYPGIVRNGVPQATYSEGVFVGYRYYDAHRVTPLFPFGFGLSYTTFHYSRMRVAREHGARWRVGFTVSNMGSRPGYAVPELYVGLPSHRGVREPPRTRP
jgi:beta-glucosidase